MADEERDGAETPPTAPLQLVVPRRRGPGRPFVKGQSGNPNGRRKGPNKATIAIREAARQMVDDQAYRRTLLSRLRNGTAGPLEPLLWSYAYGKPVDRVEQGGPGAFAELDDAELRQRLAEALEKLG